MGPLILIIEADPAVAQVTRGCVVHFCPEAHVRIEATVKAGWLALQTEAIALVIIDPVNTQTLAELFVRYARREVPAIGIIVLASAPKPGLHKAMHRAGADLYLEKPGLLSRHEFKAVMMLVEERLAQLARDAV